MYTMLIDARNPFPDEPDEHNTFPTLSAAKFDFLDYVKREGNEDSWADIYLTKDWDGTSYGDMPIKRFEVSYQVIVSDF